jgi:hypothetical protein
VVGVAVGISGSGGPGSVVGEGGGVIPPRQPATRVNIRARFKPSENHFLVMAASFNLIPLPRYGNYSLYAFMVKRTKWVKTEQAGLTSKLPA